MMLHEVVRVICPLIVSNKLVLCSPLRPAQHMAAVASVASDSLWCHEWRAHDRWLGAGEDWLQAYRHSPISFDESLTRGLLA